MHRTIKSFVLRAGRVSPRQQQGLDLWLKDYQLPVSASIWDLAASFGVNQDTIVEIGFGMGASLLTMAKEHPEINYLGIEVHKAGVGSLAADLHDHGIKNVRIADQDAVHVFTNNIDKGSLAGVQIFFPDPWPKKRHHKRRLVQPGFIQLMLEKIKVGGFIHCATDWQDYAEHMLAVLSQNPHLEGGFVPKPAHRPLTKFENRGEKLGHGVWDLIFKKIKDRE